MSFAGAPTRARWNTLGALEIAMQGVHVREWSGGVIMAAGTSVGGKRERETSYKNARL